MAVESASRVRKTRTWQNCREVTIGEGLSLEERTVGGVRQLVVEAVTESPVVFCPLSPVEQLELQVVAEKG